MIQAFVNKVSFDMILNGRPKIGETISVKVLGPALVEDISEDDIRLQFQETEIGRFSQRFRMIVV